MRRPMQPIPIVKARDVAEQYGYDQVIIIARRVGEDGGEHVTTYGRDKANCDVAAKAGESSKKSSVPMTLNAWGDLEECIRWRIAHALIVENYEEWSREVKLLRAALAPFAQIDLRATFDEYVPSALIRTADVKRAKSAMAETK